MLDSVLLIGFGGPTRPEELRPFLRNVVRGRNVPEERLAEVAHHYDALGGVSPYLPETRRQAEALRERLAADGLPLPVYVGMRNWHPFLTEALATMREEGRRHAAGIILAPHRAQTSWQRYQLDVQRAREEIAGGPEVCYLRPWHAEPLFLEALASRAEAATGTRRGAWPADSPLLFTAHSIPLSMAEGAPYEQEIAETAAGVARLLGAEQWAIAYQSRSGDGRTPWLEPDVEESLRALAADGFREVTVVPLGFLCENVEVKYDLDVEAREAAEAAGLRFHRAETVGDHPAFIGLLAQRVRELAERLS